MCCSVRCMSYTVRLHKSALQAVETRPTAETPKLDENPNSDLGVLCHMVANAESGPRLALVIVRPSSKEVLEGVVRDMLAWRKVKGQVSGVEYLPMDRHTNTAPVSSCFGWRALNRMVQTV